MVTSRSASSAPAEGWDPVGKARMIGHMNKDHSQDLSHILQHLNGLSSADAADAQMVDIDPSSITASTKSGTHIIVLNPTLEWEDRRQRLIDLTMDARRALGIPTGEEEHGGPASADAVVVKRYLPPVSWQWIVLFGVSFYFANYLALIAGFLDQGTFLGDLLEMIPFPGGADVYRWLVNSIFTLVLGIHVGESWYLDRTRLVRYGIARGSGLWWMWMSSCFMEGLACFQRFDAEVARLRAAKGKK